MLGAAEQPSRASDSRHASAPGSTASEAATHVAKAKQLFIDKQYSEAAQELQLAYALDPKPLYLFNAGQAYRKDGKRQEAMDMYQRYLTEAPDGPLAAEARTNVNDLRATIQAEENLKDVSLRLETEHSQLESEKKKAAEMEQALRKERQKPWYKKTPFIATASTLGGALLLSLGVYGVLALAGRTQGGTVTIHF